jgi:hypothetical protein
MLTCFLKLPFIINKIIAELSLLEQIAQLLDRPAAALRESQLTLLVGHHGNVWIAV